MKKITWILILFILMGCAWKPTIGKPEDTSSQWWKTTVFYEVFVRSFYDSNGDGIGDLKGLTEKLDYLNDGDPNTTDDLGITGIWLMPIHPSPSYHGYDVLNYYAINPEYGTMDDFRIFLEEAHKRGIRVIIDLVLNHSSNQHPFFQNALTGENTPYHDWYVWSDTYNGNGWHEATVGSETKYYYGYFCDCMPDFNYANPAVTAQMEKVVSFWLKDVGIDGFRIDAAKHLFEKGTQLENVPATHTWFKEFYPFYKSINQEAYIVGEVAQSSARLTTDYAEEQMDMIFDFEMANGFMNSARGESNSAINSAVAFTLQDAPDWNFATFLTNHDQNRVMSVVDGKVEKAKVAASLLLTSPGTPFIYYGEEIGMAGVKPDEDIRLPMQWDGTENGGFTDGIPWRSLNSDYSTVNVAVELNDPDSLLKYYQQLIAIRNTYAAISSGSYLPVATSNSKIYAAIRQTEKQTILIITNLSKETISDYSLTYDGIGIKRGKYTLTPVFGTQETGNLTVMKSGFSVISPFGDLPAYTTSIFLMER
jgi:glycosidase